MRPAVLRSRLLRLAPRSIAPLALRVGQRHDHCAPLRNGSCSCTSDAASPLRCVLTAAPVVAVRGVMVSPLVNRRQRRGGVPQCGRRPPWW